MFIRQDQLNDAVLARPPGESQRRAFWILLFVLAIPGTVGVGGVFIINAMQSGHCPPGSLYWGGTELQGRTLGYPWVLPVFAWIGCRAGIGKAIRQGRQIAGFDPTVLRPLTNWALAVALGFAAAFSINAAFSQFCVLPNGITFRSSLSSEVKSYSWSDVREVIAGCSASTRMDDYEYVLVMQDGRRIDLAYARVPLSEIVQSTNTVFRNPGLAYDTAAVERRCFGSYREILLTRPG